MSLRISRERPTHRSRAARVLDRPEALPTSDDLSPLVAAFHASPTATIVTDAYLRILAANPAFERLSGLRRPEWIGHMPRLERTLSGSKGSDPTDTPGSAVPDEASGREVTLRHRDGRGCRAWMSWAPVGGGREFDGLQVVTFFELDGHQGGLDRWRYRARHDGLTGLANRDYLFEELERGLARAERHAHRLALLFIDLDGFKSVNDRLGHAAGDAVLASVGGRLREALRVEDFVARYGGDEFVVMIEAPRHADDAAAAAVAVLGALGRLGDPAGADVAPVSASIGIALFPDHAQDALQLLRVADGAMYRAKQAGGSRYAVGNALTADGPMPRAAA